MDNKAIVTDYLTRVWEQADLQAIDKYFTDTTIIHSPFKKAKGKQAMCEIVKRWLEIFPDLTCYWDDFIAEGDKVVCRWHAVGTHMGQFFETTPTHKEVCYGGVHTYQLVDGKIVEFWALVDLHSILTQLHHAETI